MKMKAFTIALLTSFCFMSYGQQFDERPLIQLPDTLTYHDVKWMDADNDSLLDVMVAGSNARGHLTVLVLKNNLQNRFHFAGQVDTQLTNASWHFADLDRDNLVDILVSGLHEGQPQTTAFLNIGGFSFQSSVLAPIAADLIGLIDVDLDGHMEMILSGEDGGRAFFKILKDGANEWFVAHDSIAIHARSIEVFNFDADNDQDLFLSGIDGSGYPVTMAFFNEGDFYFKSERYTPGIVGRTAQADLNYDGAFDVVLHGRDSNGNSHLMTFQNTQTGFSTRDSLMMVTGTSIFSGDFNSDGLSDLHIRGTFANGDTLNTIFGRKGDQLLKHAHVVSQAIGDHERDGDLDILQLRKSPSGAGIALLENMEAAANRYPDSPYDGLIAKIFNRVFISWESPKDDRTPLPTLTYDVAVQVPAENLMGGEFDLVHSTRLLVSHGNVGTNRHVLLRTVHAGPFHYSVQAVDNAFFAGPGSTCKGSGGSGDGCVKVEHVAIEACRNELVTFTSDTVARWFSFRDGFLGRTSRIEFNVMQGDTVFYVAPQDVEGCALIKVFAIEIRSRLVKTIDQVVDVCEGQTIRLGVEPHWLNAAWLSASKGFLSSEDSIDYAVLSPDTIQVTVSDGKGCEIQRNYALRVGKPVLNVGPEAYQILKGESVKLNVFGADEYRWLPAEGLDDPMSPHPVASPAKTTEYVVTALDSSGCMATGRVLVIVEETAFIPNLFTPNYDGKNDDLRIYGLGPVRNFTFSIYNREGIRVYHTSNVTEAVNSGWDGTARGVEQPAGVYYWNVAGETGIGKVLLNGKNSGSIVLVR